MLSLQEVSSFIGSSNMLGTVTCGLLAVWFIQLVMRWGGRHLNLPPGPPPIPPPFHILAELLSARRNPIVDIGRITKRYGDIVCIRNGSRRIVFLGSPDLVKDVLVKQADITSGREEFFEFIKILKYKGGIIFSEGDVWIEHRRFGLAALRNFGMGKKSLQHRINNEARMLREAIAEHIGRPINPYEVVNNAVSNIICSITFGRRFEYSDPQFKLMISRINQFVSEDPGIWGNLPPFITNKRRKNLLKIKEILNQKVKDHQDSFDANDIRDVIDMYLDEVRRLEAAGETTLLDEDHTWASVFDLFLAGTETTSTALMWSFLLMAGHQEIQQKIVDEINAVIGHERAPSYEDRKNMPFTEATLTEVLRFRPIAPLGVPHMATSDLTTRGYDIPKGTVVGINILHIHHDPKIWNDPEVFKPDRFLAADGKSSVKHEAYMPFGAGRRVCLGEQLAKMEMFLFFTNILQRFTIKLPDGVEPDYGFGHRLTTLLPKPYEVLVDER